MKLNLQTVIIATMAVIIAVLAWALIFYARDELDLMTAVPDDEIPLRSSVSSEEGYAQVQISKESQAASGIVVQALEAVSAGATAEVYGVVVNVQPLIDARARYIAAVSDARALRAAATNSATEYQRQKRLFEDDRNVSERAVQTAEVAWKADQARLAAADQTVAAAHSSIRVGWGEVLAGWATNPESSGFEALAQQREVLLQLTLPYDLQAQAGKAPISVRPVSAPGESRPARFISAAPQTDATLPGVTYFYTVSGRGSVVACASPGRSSWRARHARAWSSLPLLWCGTRARRGPTSKRETTSSCARKCPRQTNWPAAGSTPVTSSPATKWW